MKLLFDTHLLADFEACFRREWLEPNGVGGWASSTVSGAHTRRYHGLLVAATRPPGGRMVLLSRLDEVLVVAGQRFELATNCFPGTVHPQGFRYMRRFEKGVFPVWDYEAGGIRLRKTVCSVHGENTTVVLYDVLAAPGPFTLELRPFVAARDAHGLAQTNPFIDTQASFADGIFTARPYEGVPEIHLSLPRAAYLPQPDWWRGFEYAIEQERGLEAREDLFTYGTFVHELQAGDRFGVIASTESPAGRDAAALVENERARRDALIARVPADDVLGRAMALSADAFVVQCAADASTIVAGYPWFADWARDAMIALPGLTLATGRHDDARSILRAFALRASRGMLPNRLPDAGESPEYNTVDAALWMFAAVREYLHATDDEAFVLEELLPVLREIVAWHDRGTRFGIRVDDDGLLTAGDDGVQLTWMDAKVGDRSITPRMGKAVEVNALWCNALAILAELEQLVGDTAAAKRMAARASRATEQFAATFWNEDLGYLYDVVDGDRRDASIRPNAIFALSLSHSLLDREKAERALKVIEDKLVTPFGLRSLAASDEAYRPIYTGGPVERDIAYHQGTVWSWLLGPYATALVKVHGESAKPKARKVLEGILPHLSEAGLGHVSEIFDGEPPHAARGCFAQAWSTAEILRAWKALGAETPKAVAKPDPRSASQAAARAATAFAAKLPPRPRAKVTTMPEPTVTTMPAPTVTTVAAPTETNLDVNLEAKPARKKAYKIVKVDAKDEPKAAKPKAASKRRSKPPETTV